MFEEDWAVLEEQRDPMSWAITCIGIGGTQSLDTRGHLSISDVVALWPPCTPFTRWHAQKRRIGLPRHSSSIRFIDRLVLQTSLQIVEVA